MVLDARHTADPSLRPREFRSLSQQAPHRHHGKDPDEWHFYHLIHPARDLNSLKR
jgi:hypothetical protein